METKSCLSMVDEKTTKEIEAEEQMTVTPTFQKEKQPKPIEEKQSATVSSADYENLMKHVDQSTSPSKLQKCDRYNLEQFYK